MQSIHEDELLLVAPEIEPAEPQDELKAFDAWDPMAEDYNSEMNTLSLDPEKDPLAKVSGGRLKGGSVNKVGNMVLCEHYLKYGQCADGDYCDRAHISPKARDKIEALEQEYEQNQSRTVLNQTYLSPIDLKDDPNILQLVTVTVAKSPRDFCFVIPYGNLDCSRFDDCDLQFYIEHEANSPVKKKLRECHTQMRALYDRAYRLDDVKSQLYLGQIVACKMPNGLFRRAMIIKMADYSMDDFLYKLQLIDIGIEVDLPRESIFDMVAEFLSEPPLCVNARLDIAPAGSGYWSRQALNLFITETKSEDFMLCKVLKYQDTIDPVYVVDLINYKTRKSIGDKLVELGLAVKCD